MLPPVHGVSSIIILFIMAPTSTNDFNTAGATPNSPNTKVELEPGIYVPTVAFFKDDEEVDVETTSKHATRLASSGIKGIG